MAKFAAKDSNKNITLSPHGTGKVVVGTGATDATVQSDGNHNLKLQTGNSTTGSITLANGADGAISVSPNGTGQLLVGSGSVPGKISSAGTHNLVLQTNEGTNSGTITIFDGADGNIDLTPNGTGEVNISKVDIDSGTISGTDVNMTSGTLTLTDAQKLDIIHSAFASGTKMLFQQTAAPSGWTKVTSSNDVALRVVSGTVGSGGSVAFETAFASHTPTISTPTITIAGHAISESELAAHKHALRPYSSTSNSFGGGSELLAGNGAGARVTDVGSSTGAQDTGGGSTHTHSASSSTPTSSAINLDVSYVDVIIATKD